MCFVCLALTFLFQQIAVYGQCSQPSLNPTIARPSSVVIQEDAGQLRRYLPNEPLVYRTYNPAYPV